jgi:predicted permease
VTHWLRIIWSKAKSVAGKGRLDREFDEELTTHLELLTDDLSRRGWSDADARREALLKLGGRASLREQHRDRRGLPLVDALSQDFRYAVRMLWKSPAFTAIVTLSLALGIGANTALFSLVDGLLLRSLPVREPDRLVQVNVVPVIPGGFRKPLLSFDRTVFDDVRARDQLFSDVVGFWRLDRPTIAIDGATEPTREVELVSANFFHDLGVSPIVGRMPEPSDGAVAIISARWWQARFDGSPGVLGRTLTVNGEPHSIIGVAPSRFHGFFLENSPDVWTSSPRGGDLMMIARLKPDVTPRQAQDATQSYFRQHVLDRFRGGFPPDQVVETELVPAGKGLTQLRAQYQGALLALMALVTLVLFTTCTNVGNLLTLRSGARRRELTVRAALGAGRSRLMLQYFVESTLLAVIGGILGLAFAGWGVSIILSMLPLPAIPESLAFHTDARILAFAAGVSLLSALLFGLAPAWRATEVDLSGSLRTSQSTTPPKSARRLGRVLVACQVGLSVLLLVGGGLFVQTLRNLSRLDLGFNTDRLLQVSIDTRFAGYGAQNKRGGDEEVADREGEVGAVYRLLRERIGAVGGVKSVSGSRNALMRRSLARMAIRLPGLERRGDDMWDSAEVGPDFFETMGIPVVRGRTFNAADFQRRGVYVVNEAFARHYYPNDDILIRSPAIIGVVPNVRIFDVRSDVRPMMYEMLRREPDRVNSVLVRVAGDPDTIAPAIRDAVQRVNPRLFVGIRTMREDINRDIARERMVAAISSFFSVLGLLLASIGIFGVASYSVAQRTKELAIRRALGAGRWSVIRESLRETSVVFGLGLVAGTVAAVALVRLTASAIADLLFGLTATDAANIAGSLAVMVTVALAACVLPAHRATTIDPLTGLREE